MLHDNLKKVRVSLGCSQQEMADKLNVNVNTYRGWEYNKREIPISVLQQLVYSFRINMNWFLTDEGLMYLQENSEKSDLGALDSEKEEISFSIEEIRILKKFVKNCMAQA